jgi:hypothetical protein
LIKNLYIIDISQKPKKNYAENICVDRKKRLPLPPLTKHGSIVLLAAASRIKQMAISLTKPSLA